MFLRKLELSGFKSFADKISLKFKPGITAVVGPNGTGKSNLADAIRWVLGEQSKKKLRSKQGADIIFAGSKSRARSGLAQVFLYLDNRDRKIDLDFQEVVVGRKFYRNQETEYLINKSRVRLQDLSEILTSAGFGQKTYSVISQGRADHIVNTTASGRKEIFEEASGIKPYQFKLEKSQRRLVQTRQNLQRVSDLLSELKPRLESLKRQVKKQEKSTGLKEKLVLCQKQYYTNSLAEIAREQQEAKQKLTELGRESNEQSKAVVIINEHLTDSEKTLTKLKLGEQQTAEKISSCQRNKNNLIEGRAILTGQLSLGAVNSLRAEIKRYKSIIAGGLKELSRLEQEIPRENKSRVDCEKQLILVEKKLTETSSKLEQLEAKIKNQTAPNRPYLIKILTNILKNQLKFNQKLSNKTLIAEIKDQALKISTSLTKIISQLKSTNNNYSSILNDLLAQSLKLKQEKQKLELEVNGSKLAIISLEKRQADLSSYLKKQKIELSSLAKTTTNQNIADLKKKINNLDEKINQTAKLVDQLLEKQSQITNRTDQTKDDLFNLERQASQKNNQIENLTAKIKLWQKTLDDLRQDNDKLIANLWLELNLEPKHLNLASKTSNSENLGLTIQKLKNRLQTLGGFDPEIIKECKTCQVRTEFLTQEKIDLESGLNKLNKVISKLENLIEAKFNQSLKQINLNFKKYFRLLFRGGFAGLTLEFGQNQDCLGIDIKAQPSGKRLKSISVLSGGEKALVSLALLFAIFKTNPTPFCVLDEVDAALDEANSLRFAKILKKLSAHTQFIAITHNRATMKQAHTLYGVTMEKNGISKIVSLALTKAEKYAKLSNKKTLNYAAHKTNSPRKKKPSLF